MLQNIFISTSLDHTRETLDIDYSGKNIILLMNEVNKKPGFLYIYNDPQNKLYIAKIKTMSTEDPNDYSFLKVKAGEHFVFIKYHMNFRTFSADVLKYLYARKNIDKIGNVEKSIFNTFKRFKFSFSRPIFNEEGFQQKFKKLEDLLHENDLANHILFEGLIIPPATENFKTYAILVEEDGEYFLTLTNEKMIDFDSQYISRDYSHDMPSYRPYFYDFFPDKNLMLEYRLSNYNDGVYEVELMSYEDERDKDRESIMGEVVFSASPIKSVPAYIKSLNKIQDPEITKRIEGIKNSTKNEIDTEKDNSDIEKKIISNLVPHKGNLENELIVYSVGQGNWSKINFTNNITKKNMLSIIFDIGIGIKPSKNIDEIAKDAANELRENYIFMLSHWDQDHIKGIVHLEEQQFEKLWIVPALPDDNISMGALRLAAFLYYNPAIESIFVDDKFNNQVIIDNDYLMLGKGEGQNIGFNATRGGKQVKTSYNNKNNLGLILAIKNNDQKVLLTGDCEYIQFPDAFINVEYDFLVASHHGAKTNIANLKDFGFLDVKKGTPAIVCVGENTDYPCCKHVDMIQNLGYIMEETSNLKSHPFKYVF
ncbi:hypothetical protein AUC31_04385 [Planococcus rifietoensis]|uniref:Metallo-beta-lactamase domain-containing protein n=1 Tax=Planococcus rifietoensis TaxID=200991 RepID=A0A0U2YP80_9BACL|nr:hypothetical protein [Planococcus rifietoensis]ALS74525.1 hypothetical protein AUC31_04385 [Planococcus rifietoensis]